MFLDPAGVISAEELGTAVGFLREQLGPDEWQELLTKLTAAVGVFGHKLFSGCPLPLGA